jgi:chromosome partitioning protein
MNKVIAFAQHKGGVGKTTSTLNIGAALAKLGKKVLLVDLDPQANLTESLGMTGSTPTISSVLTSGTIMPIDAGIMHLIPSSLELAGTEVNLLNQTAREQILKEQVDQLKDQYDYILIDCAPSLGLLTINALTAADEVLIPLQAQYLAVKGLNSLIDIIEMIKKKLNKKLRIGGVIITQYDSQKVLNRNTSESIAELFKAEIFNTKIRDNVSLAEAPTAGQNIFDYAPNSNGAKDYKELTEEILKRSLKPVK